MTQPLWLACVGGNQAATADATPKLLVGWVRGLVAILFRYMSGCHIDFRHFFNHRLRIGEYHR